MRWMEHGRTRWLGAAVGTCLVTAVGVSSALAQDATPVPSDQATPSTQTTEVAPGDNRASAAEKTALAEQLQRVTDTIATVQKDRDTVGGAGDWTAVDDLLTKATQFRDAAKATLDGDDVSAAHGQLFAAEGTAMAAEALIRAQLSDYGLPSQQAGASRTLVAAYNQIDEVSGRLSAGTDENAKGLATTAQALYKSAYDLYNAGTYARAARTAEVAAQVAGIADVLSSSTVFAAGGQDVVIVGPGNGMPGARPDGHRRAERGDGGAWVEVMPAFPDQGLGGVAVFERRGAIGGVGAGPGVGDFSTESPLDVPEPTFD